MAKCLGGEADRWIGNLAPVLRSLCDPGLGKFMHHPALQPSPVKRTRELSLVKINIGEVPITFAGHIASLQDSIAFIITAVTGVKGRCT